jgi:uroporphyrinogen III methyltransferase/synthase
MWENLGIRPDLLPGEYRAEAVVEAFQQVGIQGTKILIPRAAKARDVLPDDLRKAGAHVDVVHAYQTILPDHHTETVREQLKAGTIDMVTFTSSSTVTNFVKMFAADGDQLQEWMKRVTVACIGPITAQTAEKYHLKVSVIPPHYTIDSLIEEIMHFFAIQPNVINSPS